MNPNNMSPEQFQQRCLADPNDRSDDFLAALEQPENRAFHQQTLALEEPLQTAAKVPVPPGLKQHLKLRGELEQVSEQIQTQTQSRPSHKTPVLQWAMAASLLASIGIAGYLGVKLQDAERNSDVLRVAIVEHMMDEHEALEKTQAVSLKQVNHILGDFGLKAKPSLGTVTYAMRCPMAHDHYGAHMVVMQDNKPVTVMYMDKEMLDAPQALKYRRYQGEIVPDKKGSWAIISEDPKDTQSVLQRVRQSIGPSKSF